MLIDHLGRSMYILLAMNVVEKAILFFTALIMLNIFLVITIFHSTWMTTKIKWSRHRSFLYGCDRSLEVCVIKLGIEIPNLKQHDWIAKLFGNSKSWSSVTCEKGLTPSQHPFENDTN